MAEHSNQSSLFYSPEYTGASVLLHTGCLALLFLNLHYYSDKQNPLAPEKKAPPAAKKEPRIIMKRIPSTPTPVIDQDREAKAPHSSSTSSVQPNQQPEQSTIPEPTPRSPSLQEKAMHMSQEATKVEPSTQEKKEIPSQTTAPDIQRTKMLNTLQRAKRIKRSKMQHSWYADRVPPPQREKKETYMASDSTNSLTFDEITMSQAFHKSQSKLSPAEQAAQNFKREFQEAAVNNYISAIHHAIAFSLNRKQIMLSPAEIPQHIIMHLTITPHGSLASVHVAIPGYPHTSLNEKIKQAIMQAAPFRPFPSSIKTPELTLTINAYPDPAYGSPSDRYSSRPTPLIFTLLNNNHRNGL